MFVTAALTANMPSAIDFLARTEPGEPDKPGTVTSDLWPRLKECQ